MSQRVPLRLTWYAREAPGARPVPHLAPPAVKWLRISAGAPLAPCAAMRQSTFRSVVIREVEELDWSVEPEDLGAQGPIPLVRRRAAPRPRTLAGVGGPHPKVARHPGIDDLSW